MKIGLMGGTFNPIHLGHLINAEIARDSLKLDKVLFIPSKIPVHKKLAGNLDVSIRGEMIALAIKENKFFELSMVEAERQSSSYTIDTIAEFNAKYPDDKFYLIIGSDSFNELDTWKDYHEILNRITIIVMKRQGSDFLRKDIKSLTSSLIILKNPLIEISSSGIREKIKENKSIRYLLPSRVEEFIYNKGLYQN